MTVTAAIRRMLAAGLTVEQALVASEVFEAEMPKDAQAERRRAKDRDRKRMRKSAESAETAEPAETPSPKERSPIPPKEITPTSVSEASASSTKARETKAEFNVWYQGYPHKVQRGRAERAFLKARRLASLEDLEAGVRRYIASKPADRHWQNPATWLNGQGWLDMPAAAPLSRAAAPPGKKSNAVDALQGIFREKEWISDEPEFVRGHSGDAQCLSAEHSKPSSSVIDLRQGTDWHRPSSNH